jgi:hypothetical protein
VVSPPANILSASGAGEHFLERSSSAWKYQAAI